MSLINRTHLTKQQQLCLTRTAHSTKTHSITMPNTATQQRF